MTCALVAARCGSSPSVPSPGQPPPPTPTPTPTPTPPPPNTLPRILSLTSNPRIEADDELIVTAVVQDAETPLEKLIYEWSVSPDKGILTPSADGRQLKWKSPHAQPSPDIYTITLNVTEKYTSPEGEAKVNKADPKSVQVHYNDSWADVKKISMRYLTELFPNYSLTPAQAVQDFTPSCPGRDAEYDDVVTNRKSFHILSGQYTITSEVLDEPKLNATVIGTCVFEDIPTDPKNPFFGKKEKVTGICTLTAVYEDWKWFLCDSRFAGLGATPESLRGRVPGRIVSPGRLPLP